jgi:hypothetical protein
MLSLVTGPATPAVSTADAKTHLRVTSAVEDSYIDSLVMAATKKAEAFTSKRFINQTWRQSLDTLSQSMGSGPWWDGTKDGAISEMGGASELDIIPLGIGPLVSITSFTYYGIDNVGVVWPSTNYIADTNSEIGRLIKNYGAVWPSSLRDRNSIAIDFVAGYGAAASSIPGDIIQAIKLILAHMYENRGDSDKAEKIPGLAMQLLESYRTKRMA